MLAKGEQRRSQEREKVRLERKRIVVVVRQI